MRVFFAGAARSVTGSQHLLEFNGTRLLLDCGMHQGRRREAGERNRHLPFDPRQVDAMILSHAHIDHSGNIPTLVKQGFRGTITCTPATRDLCSVMLRDAAHIQCDPEIPDSPDALLLESTYGDRLHSPMAGMEAQLAEVINRTVARKGKILVPSFSLERTQEFVYALHRLALRKAIPPIPMYVDSPLSVRITEIFKLHPECFDDETLAFMRANGDPFGFENLTYLSNVEDSKALNGREGPMIIMAASGMCEAGRILHHLRNGIEDARNTILIHGEEEQMLPFQKRLTEMGIPAVQMPMQGEFARV